MHRLGCCSSDAGEKFDASQWDMDSNGFLQRSDTFGARDQTPEMVGHRRRLKLCKHAGRHAVRQTLADAHMNPDEAQLDEIMEKMKAIAGRGRRITDADLYAIAEEAMGMAGVVHAVELRDIAILTGNT